MVHPMARKPVKVTELMTMTRWELAQLIKLLGADRDQLEIRRLVIEVRQRYVERQGPEGLQRHRNHTITLEPREATRPGR